MGKTVDDCIERALDRSIPNSELNASDRLRRLLLSGKEMKLDVAEELGVHRSSASKIITELEERGYRVERKRHPDRTVTFRVTNPKRRARGGNGNGKHAAVAPPQPALGETLRVDHLKLADGELELGLRREDGQLLLARVVGAVGP